jgi:hypothetical protein
MKSIDSTGAPEWMEVKAILSIAYSNQKINLSFLSERSEKLSS